MPPIRRARWAFLPRRTVIFGSSSIARRRWVSRWNGVLLEGSISNGSVEIDTLEVADFVGISLDGSVMVSMRDGLPQIGLEVASRTRDPERLLRHVGLHPTSASRR